MDARIGHWPSGSTPRSGRAGPAGGPGGEPGHDPARACIPRLELRRAPHGPGAPRLLLPHLEVACTAGVPSSPAELELASWSLPGVVVGTGRAGPIALRRRACAAQEDARDTYDLLCPLDGAWSGHADARSVAVAPEEAVVLDLSRSFTLEASTGQWVVITVARGLVEELSPERQDLHGLVLSGAPGRLFARHVRFLLDHLAIATTADAPAMVKGLMAYLSVCLTAAQPPTAPPPGAPASARQVVKAYVDANIPSFGLSPEGIAGQLAIPPSALARAFAPLGGLSRYVQQRRLESAHRALLASTGRPTVAAVAYGAGFADPTQFSKLFRQRYGVYPTEAHLVPYRETDARLASSERLQAWLRNLMLR